jgi:pyruvate dehydrogenase E2 component (dihydrolipoamide acetyltransferase)
MANVTMPQLGETVVEGTILRWLKSEGDRVAMDEPLFEISTDKVDTEVPSPAEGTLTKILVAEGQTVAVGTELALIDADGAGAAGDRSPVGVGAASDAGAGSSGTAPSEEATPIETPQADPAAGDAGGAATPEPANPTPERAAPAASTSPSTAAPLPAPPSPGGPRSGILSPLVRRLAAEHDVDLDLVRGTGTGGRITKNDVLGYVASRGSAVAAPAGGPVAASSRGGHAAAAPLAGEEVVPVSHLRKLIGEHMLSSVQTAARAWTAVEVDLENVVRLRARIKDDFERREGFKLTYMPFVTAAVVDALLAYPMVNAELRGDEIVLRHYVNMGIAVSIDGGLIVPVVKGADAMNLTGLARAINDVAMRARAKQLSPDDVHGATFSITNPGPFGSLISVPIINQPNTGILSFDAVQKRPVVIDDAIAIRHMVYLSMSWDHRTIDGALATQFLARVKERLEERTSADELEQR